MRATVRDEMTEAVMAYEEKPREQWLFDYPAQVSAFAPHVHSGRHVGKAALGFPFSSLLSVMAYSCRWGCFWPPLCCPGGRKDELSFILVIS